MALLPGGIGQYGVPNLDEIMRRITGGERPGVNIPEPQPIELKSPVGAPVVPAAPKGTVTPVGEKDDVASASKIFEQLYPDIDYNTEAQKIMERSGLKRPVDPGEFKPSTWHLIGAAAPLIAGAIKGNVGRGARTAGAIMAGYLSGHQRLRDRYREDQQKYASGIANLATKMEDRAQKRAALVLPYIMMTSNQKAQHNVQLGRLGIDQSRLTLEGQGMVLKGLEHDLNRRKVELDQQYKYREQQIKLLEIYDKRAAETARLDLDKWYKGQQVRISDNETVLKQGDLNEAIRWHDENVKHWAAQDVANRETESHVRGRFMTDYQRALQMPDVDPKTKGPNLEKQGMLDRMNQALPVLLGNKFSDLTDQDKALISQWGRMATTKAENLDPQAWAQVNMAVQQIFKRRGIELPPAPQVPNLKWWQQTINFFWPFGERY